MRTQTKRTAIIGLPVVAVVVGIGALMWNSITGVLIQVEDTLNQIPVIGPTLSSYVSSLLDRLLDRFLVVVIVAIFFLYFLVMAVYHDMRKRETKRGLTRTEVLTVPTVYFLIMVPLSMLLFFLYLRYGVLFIFNSSLSIISKVLAIPFSFLLFVLVDVCGIGGALLSFLLDRPFGKTAGLSLKLLLFPIVDGIYGMLLGIGCALIAGLIGLLIGVGFLFVVFQNPAAISIMGVIHVYEGVLGLVGIGFLVDTLRGGGAGLKVVQWIYSLFLIIYALLSLLGLGLIGYMASKGIGVTWMAPLLFLGNVILLGGIIFGLVFGGGKAEVNRRVISFSFTTVFLLPILLAITGQHLITRFTGFLPFNLGGIMQALIFFVVLVLLIVASPVIYSVYLWVARIILLLVFLVKGKKSTT